MTGFVIAVLAVFAYLVFIQTVGPETESERFVIPINSDQLIASTLKEQGFIKNSFAFNVDSPYNTYKYTGLPPHPISSPGLSAIEAALHPTKTICLYYLHDSSEEIHCSDTFDGHKANIETYLK